MSSIFISHSHKDKPFSKRLANDLRSCNITVWIDEAELKIGDSLIEKIRDGIDKMEYVGVVLSSNSIDSSWVNKEVDIAMNQEIEGNRVKVLPLLIEDVELPGFLKGKLYADFRKEESYEEEFKKLLKRLGVIDKRPPQKKEETQTIVHSVIYKEPIKEVVSVKPRNQVSNHKPSAMKKALARRQEFQITDYQDYINNLYYDIDQVKPASELFLSLYQEVDNLLDALSSKKTSEAFFVRSISWLFLVASRMNINLQTTFFQMYPGICPYCLEKQCVCYKTGRRPLRVTPAHKIQEELYYRYEEISNSRIRLSLDYAIKNTATIFSAYEAIVFSDGPKYLASCIQQRVASLRRALKKQFDAQHSTDIVANEVSDLFGWIIFSFAVLYSANSLDDCFIDYYVNDCPVCRKFPCVCELLSNQTINLLDFDKLALIRKSLEELAIFFPNYLDGFSDLLKSYDSVIKTENLTVGRITLAKTQEFLEKINGTVTTLDPQGKSESALSSSFSVVNKILSAGNTQISGKRVYDVFLSYSTYVREQAGVIYNYLDNQKIKVFVSEKYLESDSKWEDITKNALRNSKLLCLIVSPESLRSEWLRAEANSAWILEKPILIILFRCSAKDLPDKLTDYPSISYYEYSKIIDILERPS